MISYLISFPLAMGEGWDGGGHRGSSSPHLNPPPPWGEEVIFLTQLGYEFRDGMRRRDTFSHYLFSLNGVLRYFIYYWLKCCIEARDPKFTKRK
jgi:hypothetical protein